MNARPMTVAALVGLGFSAASTWVHYQILRDPLYSSVCDVNATFSCTEAYTSRFGAVAGVPVALVGVLFFAFVLLLIALCQRSTSARQNLPGYIFALSTLGLAGVLYLGYASFFILNTVCLLCLGTYAAIIALFLLSGSGAKYPLSSLPARASRDVSQLMRSPAALATALGFVAAAVVAVIMFPAAEVSASAESAAASTTTQPAAPRQQLPPEAMQQLENYLQNQPRVQVPGAGGSGAAVVVVKFNDYQCPPCGQTFREYKPVLERLQKEHPGRIAFITKDFPLDPECNSLGGGHMAACEAAVAVRLAREHGRADTMEDWLFANQATLTPESVKAGASTVAGVSEFDARYPKMLELVRADIAQGLKLGVRGTPTFFMNGIQLPNLRGEFFEAAVLWELRRVAK
jgi:protein-disulfide isomerase